MTSFLTPFFIGDLSIFPKNTFSDKVMDTFLTANDNKNCHFEEDDVEFAVINLKDGPGVYKDQNGHKIHSPSGRIAVIKMDNIPELGDSIWFEKSKIVKLPEFDVSEINISITADNNPVIAFTHISKAEEPESDPIDPLFDEEDIQEAVQSGFLKLS